MSRRDDCSLLQDMLEASRQAMAAVRGKERSHLDQEPVLTLGLTKCLEIVGEAANRLSSGLRSRSPEIPWEQIVGMRNRLVHAYFDVDREQVWRTITEDLPPLVAQVERLLEKEQGGQ